MFTRLFIVAYFLVIGYLWLVGGKHWKTDSKLVLTASLLGGVVPVMWLDTISCIGYRCLRAVPVMAGIFLRSNRAGLLTPLVVLSLLFWWSPLREEPLQHREVMSLVLVSTIAFLWLQPPFALVLGAASAQTTGQTLTVASAASWPLRVVALLNQSRIGYRHASFSPLTDNLSTESDKDWEAVVESLVDHAAVIILDARESRPAVENEVGRIISRSDRLRRTLFIVGPSGEAPALHAHRLTARSPNIQAVLETEIGGYLEAMKIRHKAANPTSSSRE